MKTHHDLHLKTFAFIFIMVAFGPFGDVMLGKGMKQIGQIEKYLQRHSCM